MRRSTPMTSLLDDVFNVPLQDMGTLDPRFEGILCPAPEIGGERTGITKQFLADAETYHARYSNSDHFKELFTQALAASDSTPVTGITILDVGTGSGTNTVVPCLELFPDCQIIATDLSPDLLYMLRRYVLKEGLEDRVTCICTNAMNDFFRTAKFDLVVGASILHHLIDPRDALSAAHRSLRPGGVALFFEPFEGLGVLRIAYDLILEQAARERLSLDPTVKDVLEAMTVDWATRSGTDKSAAHFRHIDDKWLFTRDWLNQAVRGVGFSSMAIVPHASHATLFRDHTAVILRLARGLKAGTLPDWAWHVIELFDRGFSAEMKRDLPLEGTIVLQKSEEFPNETGTFTSWPAGSR